MRLEDSHVLSFFFARRIVKGCVNYGYYGIGYAEGSP